MQLQSVKAIHGSLIVNGSAKLKHSASKLVSLYVECGKLLTARRLFDDIPERNAPRWIMLIGALARRGHYDEAVDVFSEMHHEGIEPNQFVIPSVLKACGHIADQKLGRALHGFSFRRWLDHDAFVSTALIDMYSKCGAVVIAMKVFKQMAEKDLVALNAMVSGYVSHGLALKALRLVEEMELEGLKPNVFTWNSLISGFSQAGDDATVAKLFESMRVNGLEPDVVTWTSIISGMVQNFRNKEAFATFKRMLGQGLRPTSATISSILSACATVTNLNRGKEVHGYSLAIGVESDVYVRSALIDMYAKCGLVAAAGALFSAVPKRERATATWNSMIFGYANHGYCHEAVELFTQMEPKKLDHLTFTAALTACANAGLVELGQSLLRSMRDLYRIEPRLEHYACVVDLLGRAGRLTDAYDLVRAMPVEPDRFVWGALLGACRSHGNVELGEVAAMRVAELEPGFSGSAVLLSGLYSDAGRWSNAAKMKKMIKKLRLKKAPGSSWIESN
uniref:Pentatricopeptide repeat-containing protein n=1 Tax=Kalanchoe fedtschenkoi TaxID=63787 RepID=A0A7N0U3V2_KALFE